MPSKPKKTAKKPAKKSGHGGARAGAGRKREKLPDVVIKRLGVPPKDPTALRTWNASLLAEVQWLAINGQISTELAASIRANSGAIDRALPPAEVDPDDGWDDDDEDDDDSDGPELTEGTGGAALRVG